MYFLDKSKGNASVRYKYREGYILVIMEKEAMFSEVGIRYFLDSCLNNRPQEIKQGITEIHPNKRNRGLVLIYDGERVLDRCLIPETNLFVKKNSIQETKSFDSLESVLDCLVNEPDNDMVHVINTGKNIGHKIKSGLRNVHDQADISNLEQQLPDDYVTNDGSIPKTRAGNRTDAAMLAAYLLNLQPYEVGGEARVMIVKETAYGNTDFGKLAEFGPGGYLYREFFFKKDPEFKGKYLDEERKLVGLVKEYQPQDGVANLVEEKYVHLDSDGSLVFTPKSKLMDYVSITQPPQPSTPKIAAVGDFSLAANY